MSLVLKEISGNYRLSQEINLYNKELFKNTQFLYNSLGDIIGTKSTIFIKY